MSGDQTTDTPGVTAAARTVLGVMVWASLPWPAADARDSQSTEERALRRVRSISARALDPALGDEPFEVWFARVASPAARVEWSASDCGEQTGSSVDASRDLPVCVSVAAVAGDLVTAADVFVGTERTGMRQQPRLYSAAIVAKGVAWEVRRLGDLTTVREAATVAAGLPRPGGQPSALDKAIGACCPGWRLPEAREIAGRWVPRNIDGGRFIDVGDFNGDTRADVAALLVRSDRTWPLLAILERQGDGLKTGWTREVRAIDELVPRVPSDVALVLIRRGAAWGPESGDVPPEPHPLDSVELSLVVAGGSRRHRIVWIDGRYVEQ